MLKNLFIAGVFLSMTLPMLSCSGIGKKREQGNQLSDSSNTVREIWSPEQAMTWYSGKSWYLGSNFLPSTAINQLEMWQADTFDTTTIAREMGWASSLGMNMMRVYLHDLPWQQDDAGFFHRIDTFLDIAARHKIKIMFVLFDSVWDPFPKAGKQRDPKPHVHNSGWVQSPGQLVLKDSTKYPMMENYVKAVIGRYANDKRVAVWDVWNEPDNMTGASYEKVEIPNKVDLVQPLLIKTFEWARSANPSQPLTSGVWAGEWSADSLLKPIERIQLEESDIISFHCYDKPADFERKIDGLKRYHKPIFCTEYMARPNGSTFEGFLPIAKKEKVAAINWGFVQGKSQTIYPWDSWTKTYTSEPPLWFHDIFRTNGTPYLQREVDFIKELARK